MSSTRVLVVDDEADIRQLISIKLRMAGIHVFAEANGAGALDTLSKHPIDAVVLDINMPVMDGFETLRRIRSNPETVDLPVIMVTAIAGAAEVRRALQLGCSGYIAKPFSPDDLLERVQALLPAAA